MLKDLSKVARLEQKTRYFNATYNMDSQLRSMGNRDAFKQQTEAPPGVSPCTRWSMTSEQDLQAGDILNLPMMRASSWRPRRRCPSTMR
ncbi:MAG: hypothetical protein MZV70_37185 [Desulfobacterales bacterium]|nr:hypothetical protein [Desulfobacterales bacterium]